MFGETIEFKMRTFRFTSGGTQSSDPQQQIIECDLHLEPSTTIVQEQAADCTCYTQEECQVPADFTNLVGSNGLDYYLTTISSGKRLLHAPVSSTYQNAVDYCSSRGADLVLPIDQGENHDVKTFLQTNFDGTNFPPISWLRVSNDGSGWVDAKTDEAPVYGGPGSGRGHNLAGYPNAANLFVEYSYGHWKPYPADQAYPTIICELPSL